MKRRIFLTVFCLLFVSFFFGCESRKIAKLEKENAALQAEVDRLNMELDKAIKQMAHQRKMMEIRLSEDVMKSDIESADTTGK